MGIEKCKPRAASERVDLSDFVDVYEFPKNTWTSLRFIDTDPLSVGKHWIEFVNKEGEKKRFPKICVSWDSENDDDIEGVECPYCKAGIHRSIDYYLNAIVRNLQEDEPAKRVKMRESEVETQHKEKGSKSWTPVRVVRLTGNTVAKILGLSDLNVYKIKGEKVPKPVSDNDYGMDISIKYDEKAKVASNKYVINTGDKNALTDDEIAYLYYDLDVPNMAKKLGQETPQAARAELKRILGNSQPKDDEDDEDDLDLRKKSRRSEDDEDDDYRPKKKASRKDEDEDDEDYRPKKKPKKDEDDDEDYRPKKKPKKDEDDEDDEDYRPKKKPSRNDDDEDERPKKKAARKSSDDDEDDDFKPRNAKFDDEDEDERPKKKAARKPADDEDDEDYRPKKKPSRNDDEDDEDYRPKKKAARNDEEEDEPPKKKARKSSEDDDDGDRPAKKSRFADADEEDVKPTKRKRSFDDE